MKPFEEGSYIDKVLNFEALPDNIKMTYPLTKTPPFTAVPLLYHSLFCSVLGVFPSLSDFF